MTPVVRSRGYLPHVEAEGSVYFVTFRLADSLPRDLLTQFRREREALETAERAGTHQQAGDLARREKLQALLRKAERWLDRGLGHCYMRDARIAQVVTDALWHFHGTRYRIRVWSVMPNHVHVVFSPLGEHALKSIVHSWKSFSALEANRILGRSGSFWQREYFDHLVRSEASLARIFRYVEENPEKAGLRNWRWVGRGDFVAPASSRPS